MEAWQGQQDVSLAKAKFFSKWTTRDELRRSSCKVRKITIAAVFRLSHFHFLCFAKLTRKISYSYNREYDSQKKYPRKVVSVSVLGV